MARRSNDDLCPQQRWEGRKSVLARPRILDPDPPIVEILSAGQRMSCERCGRQSGGINRGVGTDPAFNVIWR